jgi:hypothetical protein
MACGGATQGMCERRIGCKVGFYRVKLLWRRGLGEASDHVGDFVD